MLAQTTSAGATRFVYGPGRVPIAQIGPDGTLLWLHADHLGSIRSVTTTAGVEVAAYTWDAYGRLQAHSGDPTITPFGFAGDIGDPETGFTYLRARYYDPATGQFITRDPLTAQTGEPYGYTGGNPTRDGVSDLGIGGIADVRGMVINGIGDLLEGVRSLRQLCL